MATHRKIIEITVKAVIDVDTTDWEEPVNTETYDERMEDAIEDFYSSTDISAVDCANIEVQELTQVSYRVIL